MSGECSCFTREKPEGKYVTPGGTVDGSRGQEKADLLKPTPWLPL